MTAYDVPPQGPWDCYFCRQTIHVGEYYIVDEDGPIHVGCLQAQKATL